MIERREYSILSTERAWLILLSWLECVCVCGGHCQDWDSWSPDHRVNARLFAPLQSNNPFVLCFCRCLDQVLHIAYVTAHRLIGRSVDRLYVMRTCTKFIHTTCLKDVSKHIKPCLTGFTEQCCKKSLNFPRNERCQGLPWFVIGQSSMTGWGDMMQDRLLCKRVLIFCSSNLQTVRLFSLLNNYKMHIFTISGMIRVECRWDSSHSLFNSCKQLLL